ncbi:MAG: cupin domain-containing protein [Chloroflexi bacterium]|nr:cupin domain-containing protein [Chloroflexota bacterium]
MAVRITPSQRLTSVGQHADMERSIAVSASLAGSTGLYSSVVTTRPGARTRIHHHGPCETSIFIQAGRARFTFGPTGLESSLAAEAGDFVYIPAGEVHVEENASATEELVVVLTRNCPDSHVVYLDGGADGGSPPADC